MIIDSSALIAILQNEPEAEIFSQVIASAAVAKISAATYLETAIVLDRSKDPILSGRLDQLLMNFTVDQIPFTPIQAHIARQAYRDYGKGSGHKAQLNFGDCFAYALAKNTGEPLLFKGDDFRLTDIECAV